MERKPYVGKNEKLRFSNEKGYVCEDTNFKAFRVAKYSKCLEDGFVGDALSETTVRYDCGLCVSYDPIHGSSSWYVDHCIGKRGAMKYAKALLGA